MKPDRQFVLEPERYELRSPPAYHFDFPRRDFFRILGGGIAVFMFCDGRMLGQESGRDRASHDSQPKQLAAWLHVGESG